MAIDSWEHVTSRDHADGESATKTLIYIIRGTTDEDAARSHIAGVIPAVVTVGTRGLKLQSVALSFLSHDAGGLHMATASFGRDEKNEEDDEVIGVSTMGGTIHITTSLQTISKTPAAGENAPDFKQAIGVTDEDIEGTDVEITGLDFSITKHVDPTLFTVAYVKQVARLGKRWNELAWKGFAVGEVFFKGMDASGKLTDVLPVQFQFRASENLVNHVVGPITVPAKQGHDYLWIRHEDREDNVNKSLVKVPTAAYVERVYESVDFDDLLPTGVSWN